MITGKSSQFLLLFCTDYKSAQAIKKDVFGAFNPPCFLEVFGAKTGKTPTLQFFQRIVLGCIMCEFSKHTPVFF